MRCLAMQRAILKLKWDTKSEPPIHAFTLEDILIVWAITAYYMGYTDSYQGLTNF